MVDDKAPDDYEQHQKHFDRKVYDSNQFRLPAKLVSEVGYRGNPKHGSPKPLAGWYYNTYDNKMVLANDEVDLPTMEFIEAVVLGEVSRNELESGKVSSASVTVIKGLPDYLTKRLTSGNIVLKPIYADEHPRLNNTCVSVYPGAEYYSGYLDNVNQTTESSDDNDSNSNTSSPTVISNGDHANSV